MCWRKCWRVWPPSTPSSWASSYECVSSEPSSSGPVYVIWWSCLTFKSALDSAHPICTKEPAKVWRSLSEYTFKNLHRPLLIKIMIHVVSILPRPYCMVVVNFHWSCYWDELSSWQVAPFALSHGWPWAVVGLTSVGKPLPFAGYHQLGNMSSIISGMCMHECSVRVPPCLDPFVPSALCAVTHTTSWPWSSMTAC